MALVDPSNPHVRVESTPIRPRYNAETGEVLISARELIESMIVPAMEDRWTSTQEMIRGLTALQEESIAHFERGELGDSYEG